MKLLDNRTMKILKRMYRKGTITCDELNRIAKDTDSDSTNHPLYPLRKNGFVTIHAAGSIPCFQITLEGRAFVEEEKRKVWSFWIPYAITTAIALLSLIESIIDNF